MDGAQFGASSPAMAKMEKFDLEKGRYRSKGLSTLEKCLIFLFVAMTGVCIGLAVVYANEKGDSSTEGEGKCVFSVFAHNELYSSQNKEKSKQCNTIILNNTVKRHLYEDILILNITQDKIKSSLFLEVLVPHLCSCIQKLCVVNISVAVGKYNKTSSEECRREI